MHFVDLTSRANLSMDRPTFSGWDGNNLAGLPKGEQTMGGIPFKISEQLVQLRGTNLGSMPLQISDIPVGRSFRKLFVLHGGQWGTGDYTVEDGTVIGEFVVHYDDESEITIPIK